MSAPRPPERYERIRELGRGAMGVVWLARDHARQRPVAIKSLAVSQVGPVARARLAREAEVLSRLSHPHVLQVYELLYQGGTQHLVLEYVEGQTLDEALRHGPLSPDRAGEIAQAIASGLAAVHASGIVHRDVKPANVLIDPGGRPVLVDFGIARTQGGEGLTQTGALMGSPHYMAPEQAAQVKEVDARADIYGLGATLYHALVGRPPFQGDNLIQLMAQVMNRDVVPPARLNPRVPQVLSEICVRCLARDPDDRFPDAAALADALGESLRVGAQRASKPWALLVLVLVLLAAGAGAAGALAWRQRRLAPQPTPSRAPSSPLSSAKSPPPARSPTSSPSPSPSSDTPPTPPASERARLLAEARRLRESPRTRASALPLYSSLLNTSPNPALWVERGLVYHDLGRFAEALEDYAQALALDPDDFDAHTNRGILLGALGRLGESLEHLRHAIRLRPDHARALSTYGTVLSRTGGSALEAGRAFERALGIDPTLLSAHVNYALLCLREDDYTRVIALAEFGLRHHPGSPDLLAARAGGELGRKWPALALGTTKRAIARDPNVAMAWLHDGLAHMSLGLIARARASLKRVVDLTRGAGLGQRAQVALKHLAQYRVAVLPVTDDAKTLFAQARGAMKRESLPEAHELLTRAIANSPAFANAYLSRGVVRTRQGSLRGAEADYSAVLLLKPKLALAWSNRAIVRQRQDRWADSASDFSQAASLSPPAAAAGYLHDCGRAFNNALRFTEAEDALRRCLELAPQDASAHDQLAMALRGLNRFAEAVQLYDKALELNPRLVQARHHRGLAKAALGRHAEALRDYDAALEAGEDPVLLNNRGSSLLALRRDEEALRAFGRALELRPTFLEALYNRCLTNQALERTDALRADARALALLAPADWRAPRAVALLYGCSDDPAGPRDPSPLDLGGAPVEFPCRLAWVCIDLERSKDAASYLERAAKLAPQDPGVIAARALLALGTERLPLAKKRLEGVLDTPGAHWRVRLAYAALLVREGLSDTGERATPLFERSLALADGVLREAPQSFEALALRAEILWRLKRWGESDRLVATLLARRPRDASLRVARARSLRARGDVKAALREQAGAVAARPAEPDLRFMRVQLLLELRRYEDARREIDAVLRLAPRDVLFWGMSVQVAVHMQDFPRVEEDATRWLALANSADAHAYRALGRSRIVGKRAKARADALAALKLDPQHELAKQVLAYLQALPRRQ